MGDQSLKFTRYLSLMLAIVVLLVGSLFALMIEQGRYEASVEKREYSLKLVEELRQSSTDLAKLARNYVSSLNPVYKELFLELVAIRDGKMARPKGYSLVYWDLHVNEHYTNDEEFGDAFPLLTLLKNAGLTADEWEKVKGAKQSSDTLVTIELQAMSLVEQDFPVDLKKRDLALAMLSDDYFIDKKANIMLPILEAEQMIISRTQSEVETAKSYLKTVTVIVASLCILLILLIFMVGRQLKKIIGCGVPELQKYIVGLGRGDFLSTISVDKKNENSVLGWIAKTQRNLAELNLSHFRSIVDSSDDAIISKSIHGIISSWNAGAERVFGYSADEMIGKPMATIIPLERQHEEPEILANIAKGIKVDHFETQRLHKDGHLVDVSVSISPIYDDKGEVIGASKIARDISKAKAAEQEIHRLAFYDDLTGLANRRMLFECMERSCHVSLQSGKFLAAVFIDLDNFKPLNDTYGHEAGDLLLKKVSQRLASLVTAPDLAARFGGDEFILLLHGPDIDYEDNMIWLESYLSHLMSSLAPAYQLQSFQHCCLPSVGVSINTGRLSAEQMIQYADKAMYEAKSLGKNRYVIHSTSI